MSLGGTVQPFASDGFEAPEAMVMATTAFSQAD